MRTSSALNAEPRTSLEEKDHEERNYDECSDAEEGGAENGGFPLKATVALDDVVPKKMLIDAGVYGTGIHLFMIGFVFRPFGDSLVAHRPSLTGDCSATIMSLSFYPAKQGTKRHERTTALTINRPWNPSRKAGDNYKPPEAAPILAF